MVIIYILVIFHLFCIGRKKLYKQKEAQKHIFTCISVFPMSRFKFNNGIFFQFDVLPLVLRAIGFSDSCNISICDQEDLWHYKSQFQYLNHSGGVFYCTV